MCLVYHILSAVNNIVGEKEVHFPLGRNPCRTILKIVVSSVTCLLPNPLHYVVACEVRSKCLYISLCVHKNIVETYSKLPIAMSDGLVKSNSV